MMYKYFVSYAHGENSLGFGNTSVSYPHEITYEDIQRLHKEIEQKNNVKKVTIICIQQIKA